LTITSTSHTHERYFFGCLLVRQPPPNGARLPLNARQIFNCQRSRLPQQSANPVVCKLLNFGRR